MTQFQKFGVIGAGAWGTALAAALIRAGRDVLIWAREEDVVASINEKHENTSFLGGIPLDPALKATQDLADLKNCDAWLLVTPVQHSRGICAQLEALKASKDIPILICSKGIEMGTLKFPSTFVQNILRENPVGLLSGPSFAHEVAKGAPTAITLAFPYEKTGTDLLHAIGSRTFRPYLTDDLVGTQIGGAIKNVLAIATGIAAGCEMGENARAALITRGLAEMLRLGLAMGARQETLMGLSGLGDLTLTCSSTQSRNMSLGYALGQGQKLKDILAARNSVAEGVPTTEAAKALADLNHIEMPIVDAVYAVLNQGADVGETVKGLLSRPFKSERG